MPSAIWAVIVTCCSTSGLLWYLLIKPLYETCNDQSGRRDFNLYDWIDAFLVLPRWNYLRCALQMFWVNMFWVGVWNIATRAMMEDLLSDGTLMAFTVPANNRVYTYWVPLYLVMGFLACAMTGTLYNQGGVFFNFEYQHFNIASFWGNLPSSHPTPLLSRILPCCLLFLQSSIRLPKMWFCILVQVVYSFGMILGQVCLWVGVFNAIAFCGVNSYALFLNTSAIIGPLPTSGNTGDAGSGAASNEMHHLHSEYLTKDIVVLLLSVAGMWVTGTLFVWAGNCHPLPERCFKNKSSELHDWVTDEMGMLSVRPSWGMRFQLHGAPSQPQKANAHSSSWPCGKNHCGCQLPGPCAAYEPFPLLRSMLALASLMGVWLCMTDMIDYYDPTPPNPIIWRDMAYASSGLLGMILLGTEGLYAQYPGAASAWFSNPSYTQMLTGRPGVRLSCATVAYALLGMFFSFLWFIGMWSILASVGYVGWVSDTASGRTSSGMPDTGYRDVAFLIVSMLGSLFLYHPDSSSFITPLHIRTVVNAIGGDYAVTFEEHGGKTFKLFSLDDIIKLNPEPRIKTDSVLGVLHGASSL